MRTALTVRLPNDLVDRLRALVRASPDTTLNEEAESAFRRYIESHPLADQELPIPRALKSGPRIRRRRASDHFVVILD